MRRKDGTNISGSSTRAVRNSDPQDLQSPTSSPITLQQNHQRRRSRSRSRNTQGRRSRSRNHQRRRSRSQS